MQTKNHSATALFLFTLIGTVSAVTYYLNPIDGNTETGNGSMENPWGSLHSVLEAGLIQRRYYAWADIVNPDAPIKAGDTMMLMSGYHGNFGNRLIGWHNDDYITIEAAPGESPQLPWIWMEGVSYWKFKGLEIRAELNGEIYRGGITIKNQPSFGNSHHIIIEDCNISTASENTVKNWRTIEEKQTLTPSEPASSGTFTLTVFSSATSSKTTIPIAYDATVEEIDQALAVLGQSNEICYELIVYSESERPLKDGTPIEFTFPFFGDVEPIEYDFSGLGITATLEETIKGVKEWENLRNGVYCKAENNCIIRNNKMEYVLVGITCQTPGCIIENNKVNYFGGDGIQGCADNAVFRNNDVRNSLKIGYNHDDLFQCWGSPNANVTIYNNLFIGDDGTWNQENNPLIPNAHSSQGFFFSLEAIDWNISNNIMVNDHYHALSMNIVSGVIENNLIIKSPNAETSNGGSIKFKTSESQNLTVRNNIATLIYDGDPTRNIIVSNNLLADKDTYNEIFTDYQNYDFTPLTDSAACDGSINGQPGVAIGALPCEATPQECIDTPVLLDYISEWKQGSLGMAALLQKIALWKVGC